MEYTENQLRILLSEAFDNGVKSVILKITNDKMNTIGYSKEITRFFDGDVITPYCRNRDKEIYISDKVKSEIGFK